MNLKIFYPIVQLTTNERMFPMTIPTERFLPHITAPSVVQVIKTHKNVAEVQFPAVNDTDIVSVDFLHSVDSPEVSILTKMLKEQDSENRDKRR